MGRLHAWIAAILWTCPVCPGGLFNLCGVALKLGQDVPDVLWDSPPHCPGDTSEAYRPPNSFTCFCLCRPPARPSVRPSVRLCVSVSVSVFVYVRLAVSVCACVCVCLSGCVCLSVSCRACLVMSVCVRLSGYVCLVSLFFCLSVGLPAVYEFFSLVNNT